MFSHGLHQLVFEQPSSVRPSKVDISSGCESRPDKVRVNHRVAIIGQAEVTPNVKHDARKTAGRKQ
jgi:hypothetical protein